nr:MAG TPA: hypothetical protein [Caudoviricetes sp.]
MILNPGLGSGGGGKPELLAHKVQTNISPVNYASVSLSEIEWDRYTQVIMYLTVDKRSNSEGISIIIDGCTWEFGYICATYAGGSNCMITLYPKMFDGRIFASVIGRTEASGAAMNVRGAVCGFETSGKHYEDLKLLKVTHYGDNVIANAEIYIYGIT